MIGQTISHYRITEKLGEGGMGVVYKAEDTKLDRPVALKFLSPHLVQDQEVRKRFEREAKAAAALSHPNVCTVYEIDEIDGRTLIAMEFVEGESLDKKIERGPLKIGEALDIARQIARGLEAAHKRASSTATSNPPMCLSARTATSPSWILGWRSWPKPRVSLATIRRSARRLTCPRDRPKARGPTTAPTSGRSAWSSMK